MNELWLRGLRWSQIDLRLWFWISVGSWIFRTLAASCVSDFKICILPMCTRYSLLMRATSLIQVTPLSGTIVNWSTHSTCTCAYQWGPECRIGSSLSRPLAHRGRCRRLRTLRCDGTSTGSSSSAYVCQDSSRTQYRRGSGRPYAWLDMRMKYITDIYTCIHALIKGTLKKGHFLMHQPNTVAIHFYLQNRTTLTTSL